MKTEIVKKICKTLCCIYETHNKINKDTFFVSNKKMYVPFYETMQQSISDILWIPLFYLKFWERIERYLNNIPDYEVKELHEKIFILKLI